MDATQLRRAVDLALATLTPATGLDWTGPAGSLTWTCWETVEHVCDALFAYAAQLGPARPSVDTHVPFGWQRRRPDGPPQSLWVEPAEGPAGLLMVFESCGSMLAAMVAVTPPGLVSYHSFGPSDPSGFAAMGVVEVLVHLHDVAGGLGLSWEPPADLCAAALDRLFPQAPPADPWTALLWSTGRADLPGRPAPSDWVWDGSPVPA